MKKILIVLASVAVLAVLSTYVFIPTRLKVTASAQIMAKNEAAHRLLMEDTNWTRWWPSKKAFQLDETYFRISKKMLNEFEIRIYRDKDSVSSILSLIPVSDDSTEVKWATEYLAGNDPVKRFKQFRLASSVKEDMDLVLDSLKTFFDKIENVYGLDVKQVKVTDSVLISTLKRFDHYPDEFETEEVIKRLRAYISANHAKELNYPMLHVRKLDNSDYEAMVAIPTDIELPDTKEFAHKRVLKGGNLLEAEVKGGYSTIRSAFDKYEYYLEDFQRTSPAIPYELLVTDRTRERDTSKWITKICYPVF